MKKLWAEDKAAVIAVAVLALFIAGLITECCNGRPWNGDREWRIEHKR